LAYRACWPVASGGARCDSFSLAQALGAAIANGSDIINLSLGGPADPLLQRLLEHAMQQGTLVVGAAPTAAGENGFPSGVAGVLNVVSSDEPGVTRNVNVGIRPSATIINQSHVLSAPGRDILSLAPGGGYAYVSGSSVAAAHVTGALAVLRALQPSLNAQTARDWLMQGPDIDLCLAVRRVRPAATCAKPGQAAP
jgi:subtilisin family serine protease